jgi:molecular chaperone HscA
MIQLTENFLHKHAQHITAEEQQATLSGIEALKQAIEAKDKDQILSATEKLNEVTRPYAERVMDVAIGEALKGSTI